MSDTPRAFRGPDDGPRLQPYQHAATLNLHVTTYGTSGLPEQTRRRWLSRYVRYQSTIPQERCTAFAATELTQ